MKKTGLIILPIISLLTGCSEKGRFRTDADFWTEKKAERHVKNRENPSKWDTKMLSDDLSYINEPQRMTFVSGVFPTPDYNLIGKGSFKGLGNFAYPGGKDIELKIQDKTVLFNSFFVRSSMVNEKHLQGMKDEVFFQVLVLTDFIDTLNYTHTSSEVISRNHPDYIGQGFYLTKNNRIDYMAFLAANRNSYAIVNMRLFDLTLGKTILIAPQKDQSFRSMQIQSPKLSSKTIETYTKQLIKRKEVVKFFTKDGNI